MKKRFAEEQIIQILKEADNAASKRGFVVEPKAERKIRRLDWHC